MTDKKLIGYSTDEGFNIVLYYSDGSKQYTSIDINQEDVIEELDAYLADNK